MSAKDKWVRRFSVDETSKHKNGFTIYKITSVLFPLESPEAVTVVLVWKRYSEVQRLHREMRALHQGLHLAGTFPELTRWSYFKRFNPEVIEERSRTIKKVLEFIAEHRLLFTSTEFVNFLQSGQSSPEAESGGVIQEIRESLHLPVDETPILQPISNQNHDDSPPSLSNNNDSSQTDNATNTQTNLDISDIELFESNNAKTNESPKKSSITDSLESIESLESIDSDLYDELSKISVTSRPGVKRKTVLPDLINFDEPSTSVRDRNSNSETVSLSSTLYDSCSVISDVKRPSVTRLDLECRTKTEDSYVFEAGYMLNLAARCEESRDYHNAFHYYKCGIEKMLIGVQDDGDARRRALIKDKIQKYLSYAEVIYTQHLHLEPSPVERGVCEATERRPLPLAMLRRPYRQLARYRVLAAAHGHMLALDTTTQRCYAVKVIQKIPNNLTEFDDYMPQREETKQPILPTDIPYMVPLHAYVETADVIFLILSYAPGERLVDYIRNYVNSAPTTPAREVNLENVFAEPLNVQRITNVVDESRNLDDEIGRNEGAELTVNEMVSNSRKLLLNVDLALKEEVDVPQPGVVARAVASHVKRESQCNTEWPGTGAVPGAALREWAAELLLCLEHLHQCGVICRDLHSGNVLLGDKGHLLVTYAVGYGEADVALAGARGALHLAPELWAAAGEAGATGGPACDYWSYGVILYELLCGVPLSSQHATVFTSHTELRLPPTLPTDTHSLLTQLLTYDPAERLGSGPDGVDEIKSHPFFKDVDWQRVLHNWVVPD